MQQIMTTNYAAIVPVAAGDILMAGAGAKTYGSYQDRLGQKQGHLAVKVQETLD